MLTKAARDEIRARADAASKGPWVENPAYESMVSATELWTDEQGEARDEPLIVDLDRRGPNREFVRYARTDIPALLDDLEAQEAEVARLTVENDRLIVIAKADEWQARYWAEHDAVADRDATIMAERANSATMGKALREIASAKSDWQQNVGSYAGGETWYAFACRLQKLAEAALQSSDLGKP